MTRDQLIQAAVGAALVVIAVKFLDTEKLQVLYTTFTLMGGGLVGNLFRGPQQVTVKQAERMAEDAVARSLSDPPPRG